MVNMIVGKRYNWKNQPDRLVYIGRDGLWYQFSLIDSVGVIYMFDIIILVLVIISPVGGVVVEQIRVKDVEECNTLLTNIKSDHSGRHSIRGYCIKEQPR